MTTTENLNIENYHGAIDMPDARDYTSEEVFGEFGGSGELPAEFYLDKAPRLSQGAIGSCTIHGSTNAFNEKYAHALPNNVPYAHPYDPWKAWAECKKRGASDSQGFIFQSALQVLKDMGYIGAYVNINTRWHANVRRMKEAIYFRKSGIATGLQAVNWKETLKKKEYVRSTKEVDWPHIFDPNGWNDHHECLDGTKGAFWNPNSWGDGGEFWIPYSMIGDLYSQYEFLLTSEQEKFIEARKKRKNAYLQKAFEAKVWNEERAAETATAREIRIMLNRALGLPEDYQFFRKHFALLCEDKILRGKMKLWNEERPYELASDEEVAMMFTRAVTRNAGLNVLVLTREQMAEVVGRDFL